MDQSLTVPSWEHPGYWRYLHELLFALNMAFFFMSIAFLSRPFAQPFFAMEFAINAALHIRQTDFIRGYFAFAIPSVLLACCIWFFLRAFATTIVTKLILRYVAGLVAILAGPLFFVYLNQRNQGWIPGWTLLEVPLAIVIAWSWMRKKMVKPLLMIVAF